MVAWYYVVCVCFGAAFFWNVPSVRPMRLESPFRLQVRRSGWFLCSLSRSSRDYDSRESREMLLLPGSGCQVTKTSLKRENDAWELHRSYFILEGRPRFKPSLAPPLANIIFIGWDPKIRGLMTLPTMTNVSLKHFGLLINAAPAKKISTFIWPLKNVFFWPEISCQLQLTIHSNT